MSNVDNKLIAVVGPTASGKTSVAVELALRIGGEIVSADSMQVYRGMDIGTAKPSIEERKGIPHHLVDVADPGESFSVALYQRKARQAIEEIRLRDAYPILAGGTGLYVRAVVDRLEFPEGGLESEERRRIAERAEREGASALHEELAAIDPEAAESIPSGNVRRVIRALEIIAVTGETFTKFRREWEKRESIYALKMFGLAMDRRRLYAMIDSRVNKQVNQGLLAEVEALIAADYRESLTARQALGYKELIEYFSGEAQLPDAIERVKRRTRRYAKRQLTWFRADPRVEWIDVTDRMTEDVAEEITERLRAEGFT